MRVTQITAVRASRRRGADGRSARFDEPVTVVGAGAASDVDGVGVGIVGDGTAGTNRYETVSET